jgi:hypothetical protein
MVRVVVIACALVLGACASDQGAARADSASNDATPGAAAVADNDEPAPSTTSDAPPATPGWRWDGCTKEIKKSMVFKCADRKTTLSLARLTSEGPPSDEVMLEVERDTIGGTVTAVRPDLSEAYAAQLQPRMLSLPSGQLSATFLDVPEGPKTAALKMLTTTLPYEEAGQHFVVVYHCVSVDEQRCAAAITSLITDGLPAL